MLFQENPPKSWNYNKVGFNWFRSVGFHIVSKVY